MILKILTPQKVAYEKEVTEVTAPGVEGEFTVLDHHAPLFAQLAEGIIRISDDNGEGFFSIGKGYLETDGKVVNILVSKAFGQDELDEKTVQKAKELAETRVAEAQTEEERQQAMMALRRSLIDMKLLQKVSKHRKSH